SDILVLISPKNPRTASNPGRIQSTIPKKTSLSFSPSRSIKLRNVSDFLYAMVNAVVNNVIIVIAIPTGLVKPLIALPSKPTDLPLPPANLPRLLIGVITGANHFNRTLKPLEIDATAPPSLPSTNNTGPAATAKAPSL